jgi:hypothetical protein
MWILFGASIFALLVLLACLAFEDFGWPAVIVIFGVAGFLVSGIYLFAHYVPPENSPVAEATK